jgi:hypothetical protein
MSDVRFLNRRSFVALGGATFIAGCGGAGLSPDLMGAAMGGAGKEANFGDLVKALHAALDKVADQTETLFEIQASYAKVFGLKERAAALEGQAIAIKRDGRTGINFRKGAKETKDTFDQIEKKLDNKYALDEQARQKLQRGIVRHSKAIEDAFVGGVMIAKVVIDARSAKKPQFTDFEALGYLKEIVSDGPMAMKFLETSKSTYDQYAKAFEFKAQIPNIPKAKTPPLIGMGSKRS